MTDRDPSTGHDSGGHGPRHVGGAFLAVLAVLVVAGVGNVSPRTVGVVALASGVLLLAASLRRRAVRPWGAWTLVAGVFLTFQVALDDRGVWRAAIGLGVIGLGYLLAETAPVRRIEARIDERVDPYVEAAGTRLGRWLAPLLSRLS
ncbi:hypothetical protein SVXHr_1428 [Halorhabdus sp. SVX81]|uniref:hypothetical protein n=1 Tax=Halorhabdus sp. SVX81 TaxID=2978283 RepID=UPI0023DC624C|nr:hypothetical protein [Halorhabdus sp. SVX81]WEL17597.1 hypothetical protein SVXHr_1428 [Halorhabdus sp. SVX81]